MLLLLSGIVLSDLRPVTDPDSPSMAEYVLWFWLATVVTEEGRQVSRSKNSSTYE